MKRVIYTKEILQEAVQHSTSYRQVLRYLNRPQAGGTQSHIARRIKHFKIDTSHFTGQGHMKGRISRNRLTAEEILIVKPQGSCKTESKRLKRSMIESGVTLKCNNPKCNVSDQWCDEQITLHVHHKNGDWLDNRIENLEFLCPNCHSQTSNFCSKNHAEKSKNINSQTVQSQPKKKTPPTALCSCGNTIARKSNKRCRECAYKSREKTNWPSTDQLRLMIEETSYSAVARELGVSDNAIRHRLQRR